MYVAYVFVVIRYNLVCCLILFVKQILAIHRGLLQVVPQSVLELLTWQELEKRICGEPEISMESLRNYGNNF